MIQETASAAQELVDHPYLAVTVVSGLFAATVALMKLFLALLEKRINEKFEMIDKHNDLQDARLLEIEKKITKYETHVALGAKESQEIHSAVGRVEQAIIDHVRKEETTTWTKIDRIADALVDLKVYGEKSYAALTAAQLVMSNRLDSVEKKMPNGELRELKDAIMELSAKR